MIAVMLQCLAWVQPPALPGTAAFCVPWWGRAGGGPLDVQLPLAALLGGPGSVPVMVWAGDSMPTCQSAAAVLARRCLGWA